MADSVWVVDTSSIIEIRRSVPNADRRELFGRLSALVGEGRLKFPTQVVDERAEWRSGGV
jgi:predicted nucleic acid-binding protein